MKLTVRVERHRGYLSAMVVEPRIRGRELLGRKHIAKLELAKPIIERLLLPRYPGCTIEYSLGEGVQ